MYADATRPAPNGNKRQLKKAEYVAGGEPNISRD